jgi:L-ascorbate metabolism protein UlaG (beta-lactamase superfamily)
VKTLLCIAFLVCALTNPSGASKADAQGTADTAQNRKSVVLKWLGNTGWEIQVGETVILIDPFLTRREAEHGVEWQTDAEAVSKTISKADFIFVGHSHADHVADVPYIARKFGSKVIGSRTTTNLALSAGVDKSQLLTITGGEKFDFDGFSVQVIRSEHGGIRRGGVTRRSRFQEITAPLGRPPRGEDFVEGGCYVYYFTFGDRHLLHQSTAGFIQDNLTGLHPDMALLAATERTYDLGRALKTLNPKTVVLQHFDKWRMPISQALPPANRKRAQRFANDIRAINSEIKVIIPEFFSTLSLD